MNVIKKGKMPYILLIVGMLGSVNLSFATSSGNPSTEENVEKFEVMKLKEVKDKTSIQLAYAEDTFSLSCTTDLNLPERLTSIGFLGVNSFTVGTIFILESVYEVGKFGYHGLKGTKNEGQIYKVTNKVSETLHEFSYAANPFADHPKCASYAQKMDKADEQDFDATVKLSEAEVKLEATMAYQDRITKEEIDSINRPVIDSVESAALPN